MTKLLATLLLSGASLMATTITFDEPGFPAGPFVSTTFAGVTFSAFGGGGQIITSAGPNGTLGLLENASIRKELVATVAGGASFVSVDLGDFNSDDDLLFLEAFGAGNASLGFTSLLIPASFTGMRTLSLSVSGIDHVQFGSRAPSLFGSSVYADNFTFTNAPQNVPEPATYLSGCFALGLSALGFLRQRK